MSGRVSRLLSRLSRQIFPGAYEPRPDPETEAHKKLREHCAQNGREPTRLDIQLNRKLWHKARIGSAYPVPSAASLRYTIIDVVKPEIMAAVQSAIDVEKARHEPNSNARRALNRVARKVGTL